MAISETDICNMTLRKIGTVPISDIESLTELNAERCRQYFWPVADALLRQHDWNFASARAILTELVDTPVFGYSYAFALPTDPYCLKVRNVVDPNTDEPIDEFSRWAVEGRLLLSNDETVHIKYTKRVTDVIEWDSIFTLVFVYLLGGEVAPCVIQDKKLPAEIIQYLTKFWKPIAMAADSREDSVKRIRSTSLLRSRILGNV